MNDVDFNRLEKFLDSMWEDDEIQQMLLDYDLSRKQQLAINRLVLCALTAYHAELTGAIPNSESFSRPFYEESEIGRLRSARDSGEITEL